MNKESRHLISLYEKAIENLIKKFEKLLKQGKKVDYQKALLNNLKKSYDEIRKQKGIVQKSLYDEYIKRKIDEFEKIINQSGETPDYDYKKFTEIDTKNVEKLYTTFTKKIKRAEQGIGKQVSNFFTKEENEYIKKLNEVVRDEIIERQLGKTKGEAIADLTQKLKDDLFFKLKTKSGKNIKMSISAYAKLNLNTAFQQVKNTASIQASKDTGTKLVKFSSHHWTCETCAKYAEGRVYSIDKRIKKYPYLYEMVPGFNQGYNSIHPNCKHLLSAYYEEAHSEKELQETIEKSKDNSDIRAEQDIKKYEIKQEINKLQRAKNNINSQISVLRGANLSEEGKRQLIILRNRKKVINKKLNSLRDDFRGL